MYNTLKRLTPVIVLVIKAAADKRLPDAQTTSSVLLIVSGCMVAGAGDLSFDGKGYLLAMLCAVMQAAYILLAERAKAGSGGGGGAGHCYATGAAARGKKQGAALTHTHGPGLPDLESKAATEGCGGLASSFGSGGLMHQDVAHSTCVEVHAHAVSSRNSPSQPMGPLLEPPLGSGPAKGAHAGAAAGGGSVSDGGGGGPLSATELLYTIFCMVVPAMAAVCMISGEVARAPALLATLRLRMGGWGFWSWLGVTAVMEGLLTGSLTLCAQLNSALTTSVVGVLKGAVSSVLGFFLLGGVKFHALNVTGIAMNMVGGAWYSMRQYLSAGAQ